MNFRQLLLDFWEHLKEELKRNIIYSILILFFGFLITYNIFRMNLGFNESISWIRGGITAIISTLIIIFSINIIWFTYKRMK